MFEISIICALFIYMVDYGLGKPGDEKPMYNSLLFGWSFYLAKKVLGNEHKEIYSQYIQQLSNASAFDKKIITLQYKEIVFTKARQAFTWQKVLGMCPVCTHFWFSLFLMLSANIFCLKENIITFGLYFLLSHAILRLLKRWI